MRVYLPATLPMLARPPFGPGPAHAVTGALREAYSSGDMEELEYAALTDAARASLALLAADPAAPRRRVVVAAEVADAAVRPAPGAASAVTLAVPVPLADVAAVHVDDPAAEPVVAAAVAALPAAQAGDDDARFVVDSAEGHELGWYATQEIPGLLR